MKDLPTWSDLNKGVRKMTDREKQIQIDAEQIRALQKQNGELTDKVTKLEAKLENIRYYLDNEIPHELINEATTIIYKMV